MTACCQLLGFSGLIQHAIKLIKGLDITMQQGVISVSVCSIISWFKVGSRGLMNSCVVLCVLGLLRACACYAQV